MKKQNLKKAICAALISASCLTFVGCGSSDQGNGSVNDVWKYDTAKGASEYNNNHTYFAKFNDTEGAVYVYSTDSQDSKKLTALVVFNVTYEKNGDGKVVCTPVSGYVHAMNGDNPIDMTMDDGNCDTWWSNTVGESKEFVLKNDGTLEISLSE